MGASVKTNDDFRCHTVWRTDGLCCPCPAIIMRAIISMVSLVSLVAGYDPIECMPIYRPYSAGGAESTDRIALDAAMPMFAWPVGSFFESIWVIRRIHGTNSAPLHLNLSLKYILTASHSGWTVPPTFPWPTPERAEAAAKFI
jgi:hypothetical protein